MAGPIGLLPTWFSGSQRSRINQLMKRRYGVTSLRKLTPQQLSILVNEVANYLPPQDKQQLTPDQLAYIRDNCHQFDTIDTDMLHAYSLGIANNIPGYDYRVFDSLLKASVLFGVFDKATGKQLTPEEISDLIKKGVHVNIDITKDKVT